MITDGNGASITGSILSIVESERSLNISLVSVVTA